ncbi:MAG: hypothetical protein LUQ33_08755 [Methanoregulaceae archaeon]|nr:hypothetical protein [Methanoregulaceae archaeon]
MNKILAVLLIVCLFGSIGIATAAKPPQVPPETPSLLELVNELKATVAGLQTSVSDLWTNATEQQSAIEAEVGARTGDVQALWANASEQQNAIDYEKAARDSADQALWTNATAQQSMIDAIQPASTVHFGEWEGLQWGYFLPNTVYHAETDGFVVAWCSYYGTQVNGVAIVGYTGPSESSLREIVMDGTTDDYASITLPVRKGDYWKVHTPPNPPITNCYTFIQWMPLTP